MTQEQRDKVIAKIKKLMALASSPNEHEAALAAERAQAILAQYNLSMSEVEKARDSDDQVTEDGTLRTQSWPWQRQLAQHIAQMYFCRYFYITHRKPGANARSGHDAHYFIGAPINIEASKMMFVYLKDTVERLAREGAKDHPDSRSGYITSFQNACSQRLCIRIQERIAAAKKGELKAEGGSNLPVLASLYDRAQVANADYLARNHGKLKTVATRTKSAHAAGRDDGRAAGNRIGLDQQVGAKGEQRRLK
jgi:hypothetical protein